MWKAGSACVGGAGVLIAVASLVMEHKLQGARASIDVAHGHSCSLAGGIFPDQESNPCLLQWQVDSDSLYQQGSPETFLTFARRVSACVLIRLSHV